MANRVDTFIILILQGSSTDHTHHLYVSGDLNYVSVGNLFYYNKVQSSPSYHTSVLAYPRAPIRYGVSFRMVRGSKFSPVESLADQP